MYLAKVKQPQISTHAFIAVVRGESGPLSLGRACGSVHILTERTDSVFLWPSYRPFESVTFCEENSVIGVGELMYVEKSSFPESGRGPNN